LLSPPVELTHHSLGDGLSDGGGTVTGRANDIVARLSSAADSGWWSLTCLYHLHVFDLACTLKASELSLERLLSPSDKAQLPSPMHLTRNHALIFHISIPCINVRNNDDYFSIAPVTLHETLMFQWRIICHMHSEEAVSECDAAFNHLILQWILPPSPLCFALSSHRQYPKVAEAYLQALLNGGYGYDVIKFGNSLFLRACIKLDDAVSILHLFALGLPSDVLPCPSYQSMMPVHAPQVNATTMVVVSINALRVGPIVGLPDSPSSTLLPPSLAGWLWPFMTEHSSFCH
jgi:hypothetical protein